MNVMLLIDARILCPKDTDSTRIINDTKTKIEHKF